MGRSVTRASNLMADEISAVRLTDTPGCHEDCMACSGEVCMKHHEGCDCDVADRHEDEAGNLYEGNEMGMRLWRVR